ncbi:MAG: dihydrolipoyl dehydrogenase [Alphaproteobacteria bacterium]
MTEKNYDVVVIGAGPGGYVAGIRAAQLGMKTAVIEKDQVGGVCLNWGCIPTKALLRSADIYRNMKEASDFGLKAENIDFDLTAVVRRSRNVSKKLNAGVKYLLKKNEVDLIEGTAKVSGKGEVLVESSNKDVLTLQAKHIILATGARPRALPNIEVDGNIVWTSKNALVPRKMPKSLLVIGSGAIGIEFADFYHTFGVEVTVVEILDKILPLEDDEVSELIFKNLSKRGIKFELGSTVKSVEAKETHAVVAIEKDGITKTLRFDNVLVAVGVAPNTDNLGLENTKVKLDRGYVSVNEWCETDEAGIYALGDITKPPFLAHKASHEAVICVEKIAGKKDVEPLDPLSIPSCVYCYPQVASIGLTEKEAEKENRSIRVGRFPFSANGKAIAMKETEGFVKTIFDAKTGELLGAHMVGAEVTELIQGFAIAKKLETTELELAHTVFPHPTLSEMMPEAALDAMDMAINF